MISINGNSWEETDVDKRLVEKLKQDFNFSEIISKLLINRDYNKDEIYSLNNTIDIINPFINDPDFISSKQPKSSACVAVVECRLVLLCSVVIFSDPSASFFSTHLVEKRILIKPVLEGIGSVAHTIITDEHAQSNRVWYVQFDMGDPEGSSLYQILV